MRKKQFEPLVIDVFEEDSYHLPLHSHTYYEIIYIVKGCGTHRLNNNRIPYKGGDLFLLSPEDEHHFEISKSTRFAFIKFTDTYFSTKQHLSPDAFFTDRPENIMRHKLLKEVKLVLDEPCKTILKNTIENIVAYHCRNDVATSPLVYFQVLSIFGLIKEALSKHHIQLGHRLPDKEEILSFVHQHVYTPTAIQVKSIASHFNIAPNYFSAYFKRNFGISYREYINQYRTKLIEKRMSNGQQTLKQIADEFGFTDESHLSNFFKKKVLMNPRDFRRAARL